MLHLSSKEKRTALEKYQAGHLALLTKRTVPSLNVEIKVASKEAADLDCVLRGVDPIEGTAYKLVQLKHLPSHQVSPNASLQVIIDGLKPKYRDTDNLIVATRIDRDVKLIFEHLDFSGLGLEQLWFFGDAASGELTLDGGQIRDLIAGLRWSSRLNGLDLVLQPIRFKPRPA